MATGHIKLGESGDLRDYALLDPQQYRATPINPMAAKIASGAGSYDDFQGWAYWVMEDWPAGAGRGTDAAGVLFGDVATFQSKRMTLPLQCWPVSVLHEPTFGQRNHPWRIDGQLTIGEDQYYEKLAFYWYGTGTIQQCWAWVNPAGASTFTVSMQRMVTSPPGSLVTVGQATFDATQLAPHPQWVLLDLGSEHTISASHTYYIVIEPTAGTLAVPYMVKDTDLHPYSALGHDGAAWNAVSLDGNNISIFCMANVLDGGLAGSGWSAEEIVDCVAWNGGVYVHGTSYLYSLLRGTDLWDDRFQVEAYAALPGCKDLQPWGDYLIGAHGTNGLWQYEEDTTTTEMLKGGVRFPVNLLLSWGGFLYAAYQNDLYYTGDGSTWTGPIQVGPDGYEIRALAGLGDDVYMATDEGLYVLTPGDYVDGVAPFPSIYSANGRRMVTHQGALYIPLRNRIWMYSPNGTFQDIWLDATVEMPAGYVGEIHSLASTHLGLVATVNPVEAALSPSVWVLGSEGWHVLAVLPPGIGAGRVVQDSVNNRLWLATFSGIMYSLYFEPLASAPVANPAQPWLPSGWVEFDWYTGDLVDVDKDWESVTLFGENVSAARPVLVYYRDTDGDWRYLGTATGDNVELHFDQSVYRPQGPKLKLGVLLATSDYHYTPSVRAIRVKYHPMITDRWRWQLALPVEERQEMPDGTINPYTADEVRSHIEALITRIPPFILEDMDGVQYEVKVVGATRNVSHWLWLPNVGAPAIGWIYALTLDQVTNTRYLPSISGTRTVYGVFEIGANEVLEIGDPGMLVIEDDA